MFEWVQRKFGNLTRGQRFKLNFFIGFYSSQKSLKYPLICNCISNLSYLIISSNLRHKFATKLPWTFEEFATNTWDCKSFRLKEFRTTLLLFPTILILTLRPICYYLCNGFATTLFCDHFKTIYQPLGIWKSKFH